MSKKSSWSLSRLIKALNHPKNKWYNGYDISYYNSINSTWVKTRFNIFHLKFWSVKANGISKIFDWDNERNSLICSIAEQKSHFNEWTQSYILQDPIKVSSPSRVEYLATWKKYVKKVKYPNNKWSIFYGKSHFLIYV